MSTRTTQRGRLRRPLGEPPASPVPVAGRDRRRHGDPRTAARLIARVAAGLVCVAAAVAAVGWLYLLRDSSTLNAGPGISGALPLQRLAQQDTQPLLRVVLAWAPAGVVAGFALGAATRLPPQGRALITFVTAFIVVFATGAVSDAITASEPVGLHLAPQLQYAGLWLGAGIMAVCAALVPGPRRRRRAV